MWSFHGFLMVKESLKKEHLLSEDELMDKVKGGILAGFLELDEKLRKIPEVSKQFTVVIVTLQLNDHH